MAVKPKKYGGGRRATISIGGLFAPPPKDERGEKIEPVAKEPGFFGRLFNPEAAKEIRSANMRFIENQLSAKEDQALKLELLGETEAKDKRIADYEEGLKRGTNDQTFGQQGTLNDKQFGYNKELEALKHKYNITEREKGATLGDLGMIGRGELGDKIADATQQEYGYETAFTGAEKGIAANRLAAQESTFGSQLAPSKFRASEGEAMLRSATSRAALADLPSLGLHNRDVRGLQLEATKQGLENSKFLGERLMKQAATEGIGIGRGAGQNAGSVFMNKNEFLKLDPEEQDLPEEEMEGFNAIIAERMRRIKAGEPPL